MKKIIIMLFVCLGFTVTNAQSNFINYQGVARDGSGNVMQNQSITIKLDLRFNTATETPSYSETHNITTDSNGVFSLQIGNGSTDFGVYNELSWGNQKAFITTNINGTEVGTTEMHAVPFALNAGGSGLEAIDEGNGIGWRLKGRNPDNFGNIGKNAIDLSLNEFSSSEIGATGENSFAAGNFPKAEGKNSFSFYASIAKGQGAVAFSDGEALGNFSFAFGRGIKANAVDAIAFGAYNDNTDLENSYLPTDAIFQIGNGSPPQILSSPLLRSNALTILRNGTILAPSFNISEINHNKALITKEYADAIYGISNFNLKIDDLMDGIQNGSSLYLGTDAGISDNGGNANVGIGFQSLRANISSLRNTAIGYRTLFANSQGNENTSVGFSSMQKNSTGSFNTAVGIESLVNNTTGDYNVAIGCRSLRDNETGTRNSAVGYLSLAYNTTGNFNTANGHSALFQNTTGSFNTAYGLDALKNNKSGNNNTAIGREALSVSRFTVGSNNTAIGYDAQVPNLDEDNQIRIGNTSVTYAGIQVAWTVTSDKRWKEQVRQLPYGLNMIQQLKPVDYIRKNNDKKTREIGFIAQDVEKTLNNLNYHDQGLLTKDSNDYISLRYNDLIPVLTKAIQEQQVMIEELKKTNEAQNTSLKKQDSQYQSLLSKVEIIEKKLLINSTTLNN